MTQVSMQITPGCARVTRVSTQATRERIQARSGDAGDAGTYRAEPGALAGCAEELAGGGAAVADSAASRPRGRGKFERRRRALG
jgi:hypothetical protein